VIGMVNSRTGKWLLAVMMAILPWVAGAAEQPEGIQSLASIKQAAKAFLSEQTATMDGEVEVSIGRLDPRLRLRQCAQPLNGFWPKGARKIGNVTVGIRCDGAQSWSIYTRGKVSVFDNVVVASRPLGRGGVLGAADVELRREDLTGLSGGYFSQVAEVTGMELRRSVRVGTVLNRSMLKAPVLIRRGEKVTITADNGSVAVRMEGKALSAGAKGDVITVQNLSSGQRVEAEVVAPGRVKVRF